MITIDSNNFQKLFQNGILISQTTLNANFSFCNGGELSIGSEWNNINADFYGKIDDVAIWNRVLNQEEIDYLSI